MINKDTKKVTQTDIDQIVKDLSQSFINDGKIVKLTGRYAIDRKPSGKETLLVECIPLSIAATNVTNTNFNKWLPRSKLIDIQGEYIIGKPKEEKKDEPT